MAIAQTKAASYIQEHCEEISSHQVISLLMDGALERANQFIDAADRDHKQDQSVLLNKLVAIINGLKNSLDMQAGGEIAQNLDSLYTYMLECITGAGSDEIKPAVQEVANLLAEIKAGWDSMELATLKAVAQS